MTDDFTWLIYTQTVKHRNQFFFFFLYRPLGRQRDQSCILQHVSLFSLSNLLTFSPLLIFFAVFNSTVRSRWSRKHPHYHFIAFLISLVFWHPVEKCMSAMQMGTQMVKLRGGSRGLVRFFYLDEHKSCIRWRPSRKNEKAKSEFIVWQPQEGAVSHLLTSCESTCSPEREKTLMLQLLFLDPH